MQTAQALMRRIYCIHDALSVFAKHRPCFGQPDLLAITLKQLDSKRLFKRVDLKRDCRLTHVQGARRLPVVQKIG
jgi:hypothetical protein